MSRARSPDGLTLSAPTRGMIPTRVPDVQPEQSSDPYEVLATVNGIEIIREAYNSPNTEWEESCDPDGPHRGIPGEWSPDLGVESPDSTDYDLGADPTGRLTSAEMDDYFDSRDWSYTCYPDYPSNRLDSPNDWDAGDNPRSATRSDPEAELAAGITHLPHQQYGSFLETHSGPIGPQSVAPSPPRGTPSIPTSTPSVPSRYFYGSEERAARPPTPPRSSGQLPARPYRGINSTGDVQSAFHDTKAPLTTMMRFSHVCNF